MLIAKHRDLIYDVGMHKGEDTDYYLKKGFRVVGFEAVPDLIKHCKDKFSEAIKNSKLILVEGAIVDPDLEGMAGQTVKFYKNLDDSVWGTANVDWVRRNKILGTHHEVIEVNTVDFKKCLNQYGIPRYLKIDIEGSDTVCLKALLDFEQKPDYVSIESEKVAFGKLLEEMDLLERLGYAQFKAVQQQDISSQIEPDPSSEGVRVGHKFPGSSSGLFGEDLRGPWRKKEEIIKEYKEIFRLYDLFGDYGKWNRFAGGRLLKNILINILHRPVPGWYDTHAKHSTTDL